GGLACKFFFESRDALHDAGLNAFNENFEDLFLGAFGFRPEPVLDFGHAESDSFVQPFPQLSGWLMGRHSGQTWRGLAFEIRQAAFNLAEFARQLLGVSGV